MRLAKDKQNINIEHKGYLFSVTVNYYGDGISIKVVSMGGEILGIHKPENLIPPDYLKEAQARKEVHEKIIKMYKRI
jgi:hypothetical protein